MTEDLDIAENMNSNYSSVFTSEDNATSWISNCQLSNVM